MKLRKDIINHYIKTLSQKINVEGVLLFGSYAWGTPTKHSDVDLIVISPDFKDKAFWDRVGWLMQQRDDTAIQVAMDIFGYTPEEFANSDHHSPLIAKVKKDGVWLLEKTHASSSLN